MKRSKASTCRELLNQIRNLSFVVQDNDALYHLHDELVKLIENLKYHAPKDESLILEKPNVVRNVSKSSKVALIKHSRNRKSCIRGRYFDYKRGTSFWEINVNRNLKFTNEERNSILQKHMLSEESINLAQNLRKEQFPKISGFQDKVIGKTEFRYR